MNKLKELWVNIWEQIKPFLTIRKIYSFLTSKLFLIIVVLILFIFIGRSCANSRDLERIRDIQEQNIAALTDEIKTEKTKSGKLENTIAGYIVSEKDLKKLNEDLYNEVKDQKGRVISLNKTVIQLRQDTNDLRKHINYLRSIMSQPIQINDSTYSIDWQLSFDWDSVNFDVFNGKTYVKIIPKPDAPRFTWDRAVNSSNFNTIFNESFTLGHYKTEITDRFSQMELVFGQKIENDQLRIFVSTNYPGFTTTSLEGVLIDPNTNKDIQDLLKKKKWLPNTWSVGVGPSFGYNILSNKIYLGIGASINYTILQW